MRNWKKKLKQLFVLALAIVLIGNSMDLSVLQVSAQNGQAELVPTEQYEDILLPKMETSAMPMGFFGLSDGTVTLKNTTAVRWIDRLDLTDADFAMELYNNLIEWTDNDGTDDLLIDDPQTDISEDIVKIVVRVDGELTQDKANEAWNEAFATAQNYVPYVYAACNAFDRDHPEVFWLTGETVVSFVPDYDSDAEGNYCYVTVKLMLKGVPLGSSEVFNMRKANYQTAEAVESALDTLNTNLTSILSSDAVTSGTDVDKIKYFNEWLTKNNEYNTAVAGATSSAELEAVETSSPDSWECISALTDKAAGENVPTGSAGSVGPVCEGYARAFKVLCDEVGIPCVLVDGQAVNSSGGSEAHMWNYVQVDDGDSQTDNPWYAVDVTWDDPVVSGLSGRISGYENETWLLVGSGTVMEGYSAGTTFIETHPVSNRVSSTGVAFINGPVLNTTAYVAPADYYLYGTINGSTYDDVTSDTYKFTDGKITTTLQHNSHVAVQDKTGAKYGLLSESNILAIGPNTNFLLSKEGSNKVEIPANAEYTLTLVENSDGTLTLAADITGTQAAVIYFDNSTTQWANVNAYMYGDTAGEQNSTWPGVAMTKVEENIYALEVAEGMEVVIFNNGSYQSVDQAIPTNGKNLFLSETAAWKADPYTPPVIYTVEKDLTNIELLAEDTIQQGDVYSGRFAVSTSAYLLPESITITVTEAGTVKTLVAGTDYTYENYGQEGKITIPAASVTGNLKISAQAVFKEAMLEYQEDDTTWKQYGDVADLLVHASEESVSTITLLRDVSISEKLRWNAEGKKVILDLAGHTLDINDTGSSRGPYDAGMEIAAGTMEICDSSETSTAAGTGRILSEFQRTIFIHSGAELILTGGIISGNIYMDATGQIKLGGALTYSEDKVIALDTAATGAVLIEGWDTYMSTADPATYFTATSTQREIRKDNTDGKLYLDWKKGSIPVSINWDDADNAYGKRPENVTVKLKSGTGAEASVLETVVLQNDAVSGNWRGAFADQYLYPEDSTSQYAVEVILDENTEYTYSAALTAETVADGYTITMTLGHQHVWSYQNPVVDDVLQEHILQALCTGTHGECTLTDRDGGRIVITVPTAPVYDGTYKVAELTNTLLSGANCTIRYQKWNQENAVWEECADAPVGAGTYKAYVTLPDGNGTKTAQAEYTVVPIEMNNVIVTGTEMTYEPYGDASVKVDAVTVTGAPYGAVISYSCSTDGSNWTDYSTTMPQIANIGAMQVKIKVKVTLENYKDYETQVTAVIHPYDITGSTVTLTDAEEYYYKASAVCPKPESLTVDVNGAPIVLQDLIGNC